MTHRRLLLISSSRTHGTGYLDHCAGEIVDFLGPVDRVLFVPFALRDHDGYAATARERFATLGYGLDSVHEAGSDPEAAGRAVAAAAAFFVGGGNTFRLLKALYDLRLLAPIRERVAAGAPYVGTSAGSNVACATLGTTNDMPIVEPPSFDALDLVPFNLNPHYVDPDPGSTHQGETREERILQYLEENDRRVVGLREGGMLRVEGDRMTLEGAAGARLFARGRAPEEVRPGASLDALVREGPSA
jgi:dipeptidase E